MIQPLRTLRRLCALWRPDPASEAASALVLSRALALPETAGVLAGLQRKNFMRPREVSPPSGKRILVLAPHPDDEIIGPGGTLIGAVRTGSSITVAFLTCGRNRTEGTVRYREACDVTHGLGFAAQFLGYDEGSIPGVDGDVERLRDVISECDPQIVFVPFMLDDHADHRQASALLTAAVLGGTLSGAVEVWAYQVYTTIPANVVVNISVFADDKARAIREYQSEATVRDWAHWSLGLNAFCSRYLNRSSEPLYAEMFFVMPASEYASLCRRYFDRNPDQTFDRHSDQHSGSGVP